MGYAVELTDTFAGEANYCWVRRALLPETVVGSAPYNSRAYRRRIAKAARDAVGANGRGRWTWYGDYAEWRPYGVCAVLFVTWTDREPINAN